MEAIYEFIKSLELRELNEISIVLRYVLAVLCGGIIGLEREHKHRPAGFRTHILVCMGAASTSLTGQYLLTLSSMGNGPFISDPLRLSAQVIAGIGFIGAGTIIVTKRRQVKGLTTAAGLWVSAIVGLCCGAGFYEGAIFATLIILLAELVFARLEYFIVSHAKTFTLFVEYTESSKLANIMDTIKGDNVYILDMEVSKSSSSSNYFVTFSLKMPRKKASHQAVMTHIAKIDSVVSVEEL